MKKRNIIHPNIGLIIPIAPRYVEKLEQQQLWLVHGLQSLYHCITTGEGWPGDPLNIEPNGYPLTHDLLTRLGALDDFLGERFEENPEILHNRLWRRDLQCRESSVGSYKAEQSPLIRLHFSPDASSQQTMSPTSPAYNSPANKAQVKEEPMLATRQHSISSVHSIQDVINPLALQGGSATSPDSNDFSIFDEMDMMNTVDYSNLIFDEPWALTEDQAFYNQAFYLTEHDP